ncbi:MAG: peptidoglycan DD-metalloendopeptidase family protein [Pseudaminobacter sp.]|nr:peptidoglycan DD-metalloendopeptidase family protein [Pseudaminobacter sp.]
MHQIDDSFRRKRSQAREQRTRALRRRLAAAACLLLVAGAGVYFVSTDRRSPPVETPKTEAASETVVEQPSRPVFVNAIVDLAGDPLIIRLGSAAETSGKLREIPLPPELEQPGLPETLEVLSDTMLSSSQRIMALPSSPEDFAFFQSQSGRGRSAVLQPLPAEPEAQVEAAPDDPAADASPLQQEEIGEVLVPVAGQDDLEGDLSMPLEEEGIPAEDMQFDLGADTGMIGEAGADTDAGWGATVGQAEEALPGFKATIIEDTTTVHFVKRGVDRFGAIEDFTVSVKGERSLESIVAEYGFSAEDAKKAGEAAKKIIGIDLLGNRYVVGLRGFRPADVETGYRLAQLSLNSPEKYLGTIALADNGAFVAGADPWIDEDLSRHSRDAVPEGREVRYRLLDAIYSTATRNDVPGGVTGEAIMLMSRTFDLQALAAKDDRLVIVFSASARDEGRNAGRVLYAAIRGGDRTFECFVYQATPGGDFSCMSEKNETHSVTVANGMVNPVNGVLTSTFGPRRHPILKKVRLHKGVDWKAPIGTPVMAAFDGTVEFAGDGKGYGNVVRISHGQGKATAYAHLSRFEAGVAAGLNVSAGEIVGYVGTTGLSTGPHLHFELYINGVAIDPLATAIAEASDGTAVDQLVNRIIRVESGGNARAKNPLSSATGLGQFIKSTWLRMMKTYRPDLFNSLSTEDLLALRFDPTISRQMVANLARENEARLRSRGHGITAGRLYLAHFLGPEGANIVLSAPGDSSLAIILGQQVITANPFLTGKDAAYVVAWAEKKMSGKAGRAVAATPTVSTKTVVRTSPEFVRYREAMQKVAEGAETAL